MNRISNPLLMLIPEQALGPLLLLMLVGGGLLITVGARRAGGALVTLAIAIPFITVVVEALFNDLFAALPEGLVQPVAWLIMLVFYAVLGFMLLKLVVGQKAIDQAKGQLIADATKGLLKLMFRLPVMLLWVPVMGYLMWSLH
jgi:hypothetical protein